MVEALNGRIEHPRGSALGFRNLHQLRRPISARDRRVQTSTTPSAGAAARNPATTHDRLILIVLFLGMEKAPAEDPTGT